MSTSTPIATAQVKERRQLRFKSLDEALAEEERLASAQRQGTLRCLGNWSPAQNLNHLASWVDYSFDGVPFRVPFIAKLFMKPLKNRMLYKPMRAGSRIPKLPLGTVGQDPIPFDEADAKFRKNFTRLKTEIPKLPNALLGPLTHDQWINLHLRHAELHLSFMQAN
jgi:hypothetical protein